MSLLLVLLRCSLPWLLIHNPAVALAEVVEVDVGMATDHVADVLFVVDSSNSVGANYIKMRTSFMDLLSNFRVGDKHLRIAVIQCHGYEVVADEDLILLHLERGNSVETVNAALGKLKTMGGNPFVNCFAAALNGVFVAKHGDRPNAPNIIIFTSDSQFEAGAEEPIAEVETLKRKNVTIIAISYCRPHECNRTISNNNKIASRPEYSVKMDDFNANNEEIKNALRHSASCKQRIELADCAWVDDASCARSVVPEPQFSNEICQMNANTSVLLTEAAVRYAKPCVVVRQLTSNMHCYLDQENDCRIKSMKIERRQKNQVDYARSGDPIEEDFKACGLAEPKGEPCPKSICMATQCNFGADFDVDYCANVHFLRHCVEKLQLNCQGWDDIDVYCYPFYYARNKTTFVDEEQVSWTDGKPILNQVEMELKVLCENNTLQLNCSKWMKGMFNTSPIDICFSVGSTGDDVFDPALANSTSTTASANSTQNINTGDPAADQDAPGGAVKRRNSSGIIISIIIVLLFLVLIVLIFAVVVIRNKKKTASKAVDFSVNAKNFKAKTVALAVHLNERGHLVSTKHGVNTRSVTTNSTVSGSKKVKPTFKKKFVPAKQKTKNNKWNRD